MYVLKNLMDSFKVNSSGKCSSPRCYFQVGRRETVGTLMGKDPFGNSYYELPAQPQVQDLNQAMQTWEDRFESTLHSWESGCLPGGTTQHRPTKKRFCSLLRILMQTHIISVQHIIIHLNQVMGMHESAAGFDTNLPSEW